MNEYAAQTSITTIAAQGVSSLVWQGDLLVDWAKGGVAYSLDGDTTDKLFYLAHNFDAAVASPSDEYVVVYTKYGTKGLLLHKGKHLREINRSYYFAGSYEYPIALFCLPDGREVVAHCPEAYNQIEIDVLETGQRLTATPDRKPGDMFHSRLQASSDGRYLLSAGWEWHPIDTIELFDVDETLASPLHLDHGGLLHGQYADLCNAVFRLDGCVVAALDGDIDGETNLRCIRIFEPDDFRLSHSVRVDKPVGRMMPLGKNFLLAFYDSPRMIDLRTGKTVQSWDNIFTGKQMSSIKLTNEVPIHIACDAPNRRCAIANEESITVMQFPVL